MAIATCATVRVVGVPPAASAGDLLAFLSSAVGSQAIASDIPLLRRGWLPRTTSSSGEVTARVQFAEADGAAKAVELFRSGKLPPFGRNRLEVSSSNDDIVHRASSSSNRLEEAELLVGIRQEERTMEVRSYNFVGFSIFCMLSVLSVVQARVTPILLIFQLICFTFSCSTGYPVME